MAPCRRLHVVFVALAVAALVAPAITPVTSSAPPETLCTVCSDEVETIAESNGVALDTDESRLTIRVAENGSSRWTARVRLLDGADELRANRSLQHALVTETTTRHVVSVERRTLTTAVEGDTFVVSYRGPDVGYRSVGVFVFDLLAREPHRAGVNAGADRVVLRAPPNSTVATTPRAATTWNETAVVWADPGPGGATVEQSYVTFAPSNTLVRGVRGQVAVALAVGPRYVGALVGAAALPALTLIAMGTLLGRTRRRNPAGDSRHSTTLPLVGFGLAVVGVAWLAIELDRGTIPGAPTVSLWLIVPTVVFFALGYVGSDWRRSALLGTLALLPVVAVFLLGLTGFWALLVFVPATVATLALGVPAFFLGRATAD